MKKKVLKKIWIANTVFPLLSGAKIPKMAKKSTVLEKGYVKLTKKYVGAFVLY